MPDTEELKRKITNIIKRESALLSQRVIAGQAMLKRYSESRALSDPKNQINDRRMSLISVFEKLTIVVEKKHKEGRANLAVCAGKLSVLDPLAVL